MRANIEICKNIRRHGGGGVKQIKEQKKIAALQLRSKKFQIAESTTEIVSMVQIFIFYTDQWLHSLPQT